MDLNLKAIRTANSPEIKVEPLEYSMILLGFFILKNRKKIQYSAVAELDPVRRKEFIEKFKIPEKNAKAVFV